MSEKNKDEIIEGALAGGIIGAALGAFLTGKGRNTIVSALVGAAIGASVKARKEAQSLNVPIMYEEEGEVYLIHPDGRKEYIKTKETRKGSIPRKFSLD